MTNFINGTSYEFTIEREIVTWFGGGGKYTFLGTL